MHRSGDRHTRKAERLAVKKKAQDDLSVKRAKIDYLSGFDVELMVQTYGPDWKLLLREGEVVGDLNPDFQSGDSDPGGQPEF